MATTPTPEPDSTPPPGKGDFGIMFPTPRLGLSIDSDSKRHDLPLIVRPTSNTEMRPGDKKIFIA